MRGGDPVARWARRCAAALPAAECAPLLLMRPGTRDSVGLSAAARRRNLAGHVGYLAGAVAPTRVRACTTVLLDDVVTTGATAAESVRVLSRMGHRVAAVVALTAA
jgi:predicted amidophosphoribosyltransferase